MKILHCSDIHLGRRRLDGRLPDTDFAEALSRIVDRALKWKAQAVLIAGDLFDTPQIPPPVLRQAEHCLAPLKKKNIPIVAIEGNHDRAVFNRKQISWVRYLAEEDLLILLETPFTPEGPKLTPYNPKTREGSYWDFNGLRFVGAGYLGAGTDRKVHAIVSALPNSGAEAELPVVMLLHAGPEYFVGEGGGFRKETLSLLQERILYLALGHIHKPMQYGEEPGRPWAVNPGSPENCRLDEANTTKARGWAELEIDPQALPGMKLVQAQIMDCPRRPVLRLDLDVSAFGNKLKGGIEKIEVEAVKVIKEAAPPERAVVRLFLVGTLNIGRIALEPQALGQAIAQQAGLAGVEVNLGELQLYTGRIGSERPLTGLSNEEIERVALEELLRKRPPEELEDDVEQTIALYSLLRDCVARNRGPEAILECMETSPLPAKMVERFKGL